jgi:hypothetical protein
MIDGQKHARSAKQTTIKPFSGAISERMPRLDDALDGGAGEV